MLFKLIIETKDTYPRWSLTVEDELFATDLAQRLLMANEVQRVDLYKVIDGTLEFVSLKVKPRGLVCQ